MSTNAQFIDQAMGRLGQRTSTKIRANVVEEINTAIEDLERGTFFPWFLSKTATLSVVANDTFKDLPSDFALEEDETRPYYVEEGTVFYLTKRFYGTLLGETPTSLKFYATRGTEFHFRIPADKSYDIIVPYYAKTIDPLVDDTTPVSNLWLLEAKNWILGKALSVVAATNLQNLNLATTMAALEVKSRTDVYNYHEARMNQNQDFEVGGATDGS